MGGGYWAGLRKKKVCSAGAADPDSLQPHVFDTKKKQYQRGTEFSNAFPLFLGLTEPADEPAVLENILRDLERR